jgi:hypothetical protein
MNVAVKTKWRYNAGSSLGDTTSEMVACRSNEHAATVPTARCFEFPKRAYIRGGTKLESTTKYQKSSQLLLHPEHYIYIYIYITNVKAGHMGLTEADDWRKVSKFCVADSLRDCEACNGDTRKQIVSE